MMRRLALTFALAAVVCWPMAAQARPDAPDVTHVDGASYEEASETIVVPWEGRVPNVAWGKPGPNQYLLELSHSELVGGKLPSSHPQSALLSGWTLAENQRNHTVELRLRLQQELTPTFQFVSDPDRLVIRLLGDTGRLDAKTAARRAAIHAAQLQAARMAHLAAAPKPHTVQVAAHPAAKPAGPQVKVATRPAAAPPIMLAARPQMVAAPRTILALKPAPAVKQTFPGTMAAEIKLVLKPKPVAPAIKHPTMFAAAAHPEHALKPAKASHEHVLATAPVAVKKAPTHAVVLAKAPVAPKPAQTKVVLATLATESMHAAAPRTGSPSRAGAALFDATRQAVVIPIQGDFSLASVTIKRLNQRWAYLDLPNTRPSFVGIRYQDILHSSIKRWVMSPRPQGKTRVSIALLPGANLVPSLRDGHLMLALQSASEQLAAKPAETPAKTASAASASRPHKTLVAALAQPAQAQAEIAKVGQIHYDEAHQVLVIPVSGPLAANKLQITRLNKRWAYVDLPGARPTFTGVRYCDYSHRPLLRWVMARRPRTMATRLALSLEEDANVHVELTGQEIRLAITPHTKHTVKAAALLRPAA